MLTHHLPLWLRKEITSPLREMRHWTTTTSSLIWKNHARKEMIPQLGKGDIMPAPG